MKNQHYYRSVARSKVWQSRGILFLFFIFSISLGTIGFVALIIGLVVSNTYGFASLASIKCSECDKPVGVSASFLGNIDVPSNCVSCKKAIPSLVKT
ncbi:hypothetical protein [Paraglaciecola chathamensis]|uniref:hypothetical protein n=1 Tax=Paraglaciecola chathamensis TaxID=368405 RepID=UPI00129B7BB1|nr:hypothetical protein [Paraglaciecola chathamensis]